MQRTYYRKPVRLFISFLLTGLFTTGLAQQSPKSDRPSNPLSFMEPFIGSWGGPEGAADQGQESEERIGFHFEWANESKQVIYFYEGYLPDKGEMVVENFLTYNPLTLKTVFIANNYKSPMLFKGTFNKVLNGFERRYQVWYTDTKYLTEAEKQRGGFIEWADTCKMLEDGSMHCKTERIHPDGKRTPFDPNRPEGWTMKRKG